jgi:hypothetical protein
MQAVPFKNKLSPRVRAALASKIVVVDRISLKDLRTLTDKGFKVIFLVNKVVIC